MSVFPLRSRVLNSWQMNVAWQPESCVSLATHEHYRQSVHSAHNHTHHFNSQFSRWTWVSRLPPWLAFSTYYSAVRLHPLGTPKLFISLRHNPIKSFLRWPPLILFHLLSIFIQHFGHVECTDNASWVKCCMKMESKWNKIEGSSEERLDGIVSKGYEEFGCPKSKYASIYLSGWLEWLGPVPTNLWSLEFLLHSFNIKKTNIYLSRFASVLILPRVHWPGLCHSSSHT